MAHNPATDAFLTYWQGKAAAAGRRERLISMPREKSWRMLLHVFSPWPQVFWQQYGPSGQCGQVGISHELWRILD